MNVLIFGLGLHGGGIGAANYFLRRGDRVTITDLKREKDLKDSLERLNKNGNLKLTLGKHDFKDIEQADLIIKNPAVPPDSPYIRYAEEISVPIDTDIGVFLDIVTRKTRNIIAVTGTRGKSTTTSLIYEIFRRKYRNTVIAGNITISVFDIINEVKENSWIVLELSSFQLGGIRKKKYSPPYALITNLFEDHLNYYRNIEQYFDDKKVICKFQKAGDVLVLNRENMVYEKIKPNKGVRFYSFGFKNDSDVFGSYTNNNAVCFKDKNIDKEIVNKDSIKLKGNHNLLNICASVTMAMALGVEESIVKEAVVNFKGLEHRIEYIGNINGIDVYNDSASTTPEALISALDSFKDDDITLIMGGTDKSLSLKKLISELNRNKDIKNLILLDGSGTRRLINEGLLRSYKIFNDFKNAVYSAFKVSAPGTVLLFSPAFASFEMFLNEFDRGRKFKKLVNSLL